MGLTLPTVFRLSNYAGVDQVPGHEGQRYALLVGPVVLACVGPVGSDETTVLPLHPVDPPQWLIPTSTPLHFAIKGVSEFYFKPLYALTDSEKFTVYPIFGGES